jgi:hypothetical protein
MGKTNSFKKQFYKESFTNQSELIKHKQYNILNPQPDDSTSKIQHKKGISNYTQYDNAYNGKLY